MFFWFGFPFIFLIPLFLTILAVRAGTNLFRHFGQRNASHMFGRGQYDQPIFPDEGNPWMHRAVGGYDARIFQLAYKRKGRLTISDVVIETGLSVEEAEQLMQRMTDNTRVRMEVDNRGMVTYEFPEILARFENEEL